MDRFTSSLPTSVVSLFNKVESIAEAAIASINQTTATGPTFHSIDLSTKHSINISALIFDGSDDASYAAVIQTIDAVTSLIISLGESPFTPTTQALNCIDLSMAGHAAPPLPSLAVSCAACRRWCELSPSNRVYIHTSLATVQRAALVIAAIRTHFDSNLTANHAVESVTQSLADAGIQCWLNPSQTRYASEYLTHWLKDQPINSETRMIDRIIVSGQPSNQTIKRTGRVYCQIFNGGSLVASKYGRDQVSWLENGSIVYEVQCAVIGDCLIRLRHVNPDTQRTESVVRTQLHTSMMESVLRLTADQLDGNQAVYKLEMLDLMSTSSECNTPALQQQAKEMERAIAVMRDRRPLHVDIDNVTNKKPKLLTSAVRAAQSLITRFSLFGDEEDINEPANEAVDENKADAIVERSAKLNTRKGVDEADSDSEDEFDTAIADDIDLDEDLDLDSELDDDEARELLEAINELEDLPEDAPSR